MDKQSILKFFNDNTVNAPKEGEKGLQVVNHGNLVVNYGNHATTNVACTVNNNDNLTQADKDKVNALIRSLEAKNR